MPSLPSWQASVDAVRGAAERARLLAGAVCANPACANVSGLSERKLALRRCTGCNVVRYCSAGCAREAWRAHKPVCAELARSEGS